MSILGRCCAASVLPPPLFPSSRFLLCHRCCRVSAAVSAVSVYRCRQDKFVPPLPLSQLSCRGCHWRFWRRWHRCRFTDAATPSFSRRGFCRLVAITVDKVGILIGFFTLRSLCRRCCWRLAAAATTKPSLLHLHFCWWCLSTVVAINPIQLHASTVADISPSPLLPPIQVLAAAV